MIISKYLIRLKNNFKNVYNVYKKLYTFNLYLINAFMEKQPKPTNSRFEKKSNCQNCIHRLGCGLALTNDYTRRNLCYDTQAEFTKYYSDSKNSKGIAIVIPEPKEHWNNTLTTFIHSHIQ